MLAAVLFAAVLCFGLLAWAGLFRRLSYWMWTTDLNRRLAPAWYERNRVKIEAMRARGR